MASLLFIVFTKIFFSWDLLDITAWKSRCFISFAVFLNLFRVAWSFSKKIGFKKSMKLNSFEKVFSTKDSKERPLFGFRFAREYRSNMKGTAVSRIGCE